MSIPNPATPEGRAVIAVTGYAFTPPPLEEQVVALRALDVAAMEAPWGWDDHERCPTLAGVRRTSGLEEFAHTDEVIDVDIDWAARDDVRVTLLLSSEDKALIPAMRNALPSLLNAADVALSAASELSAAIAAAQGGSIPVADLQPILDRMQGRLR